MATSKQQLAPCPVMPGAAPGADIRARRLRCVIADGSPFFLELLGAFMEKEDMVDVVATVCDGASALEAVGMLNPDVVLMGARMPRMSGLTACLLVRQFFPQTRVLLTSPEDSAGARAECHASGAAGFLYKPRFMVDLAEILLPEKGKQPCPLAPALLPVPAIDLA